MKLYKNKQDYQSQKNQIQIYYIYYPHILYTKNALIDFILATKP